jgi:hypothetical protein
MSSPQDKTQGTEPDPYALKDPRPPADLASIAETGHPGPPGPQDTPEETPDAGEPES